MADDLCDSESGVCSIPANESHSGRGGGRVERPGFIYIGDPMCSWCWGMSSTVQELQRACTNLSVNFSIIAGGLRPGGGEKWDSRFRAFLRTHWEEVSKKTGQTFHYDLLARDSFNYDTEPSCRAVVAASHLLESKNDNNDTLLRFFASIQKKFYVDNADPGERSFYREICVAHGLAYDSFIAIFDGFYAKEQTQLEFKLNRDWGVRGYPSFAISNGGMVDVVASGFVMPSTLVAKIERSLAVNASKATPFSEGEG